jgi:hypothetical protein
MDEIDGTIDRAISDFEAARERFELFNRFYLSLTDKAKGYLRKESKKYKRSLREIQKLILPTVKELCPICDIQCCKLYTPELSIYIAGTVGGFNLNDYLLIRCNEVLPEPVYDNAEKNLCPFWVEGCILPLDCRSFLCVQFFCNKLKEELDMELVSKSMLKARSILNDFSIGKCMV